MFTVACSDWLKKLSPLSQPVTKQIVTSASHMLSPTFLDSSLRVLIGPMCCFRVAFVESNYFDTQLKTALW